MSVSMLSYFYAKSDLRNRDNWNPIQILLKSCTHMHLNVVIMGGNGNGNLERNPARAISSLHLLSRSRIAG